MFNVGSLGITDREEFFSYGQEQIQHFHSSITLKDGKYYVQLPWHADKLAYIPSSYAVALRILNRVVRSLEKKGLYRDYLEMFFQQEQKGIIDEIFVSLGILGILS